MALVFHLRPPPTRSGRRIMFVTLEDETGLIDLMVAPEAQKDCGRAVMTRSVVHLEGVVRRSEKGGLAITAEQVVPGMPDPLEMTEKPVGLVAAARAALASLSVRKGGGATRQDVRGIRLKSPPLDPAVKIPMAG